MSFILCFLRLPSHFVPLERNPRGGAYILFGILSQEAHRVDCPITGDVDFDHLIKVVSNRFVPYQFSIFQATEMAQWVKEAAARPDNLISITRSHIVEGENQLCRFSCDLHKCTLGCKHTNLIIHLSIYPLINK